MLAEEISDQKLLPHISADNLIAKKHLFTNIYQKIVLLVNIYNVSH